MCSEIRLLETAMLTQSLHHVYEINVAESNKIKVSSVAQKQSYRILLDAFELRSIE